MSMWVTCLAITLMHWSKMNLLVPPTWCWQWWWWSWLINDDDDDDEDDDEDVVDDDSLKPRDNWSSITSSNSWWNCISFFSSPNLHQPFNFAKLFNLHKISLFYIVLYQLSSVILLVRKVKLESRLQSWLLCLFSHLLSVAVKQFNFLSMSVDRNENFSLSSSNWSIFRIEL